MLLLHFTVGTLDFEVEIDQRIVRLHGGEVSFEANPDGGTVFTVSLPKLQMEK